MNRGPGYRNTGTHKIATTSTSLEKKKQLEELYGSFLLFEIMTHTYGFYWQSNAVILCLISGLLVGSIAGARMFIFGKVTGISGFLSGLIELKPMRGLDYFDRSTRLLFVAGLVVSLKYSNSH